MKLMKIMKLMINEIHEINEIFKIDLPFSLKDVRSRRTDSLTSFASVSSAPERTKRDTYTKTMKAPNIPLKDSQLSLMHQLDSQNSTDRLSKVAILHILQNFQHDRITGSDSCTQ